MYTCSKCGNTNLKYISFLNNRPYCRLCISFDGKSASQSDILNNPTLSLDFKLSRRQKEISDALIKAQNEYKNVFLYAVTGAGKTEIVFESILNALKKQKQVGFVVPRKDVVIDLLPRFKKAFKTSNVISVYGGNNNILEGDIILLTTHQLYRYNNYFNYLIFDEIDAFPYEGNDVLKSFFLNSIKGSYVMMSATPSKEKVDQVIKSGGIYLELLRRYHNVDLPIPKIKLFLLSFIPFIIKKIYEYQKENKQCFIFIPTIQEGESLYSILKRILKHGNLVHSQRKNRAKIIDDFKHKKYSYLITTSVLERGVTVKDLQVIVCHADHKIYDEASLIQISGRVGRKFDAPTGEVLFLGYKNTMSMQNAIAKIKGANLCKVV